MLQARFVILAVCLYEVLGILVGPVPTITTIMRWLVVHAWPAAALLTAAVVGWFVWHVWIEWRTLR